MSLQPKITVLSQDNVLYGSITLQDSTGAYNATTNPGGYGSPNPATGDVTKVKVREEYMGDSSPKGFEDLVKAEMLGSGTIWKHNFREGVTKLTYIVGTTVGLITALKGNSYIDLADADDKLAGCTFIEFDGNIYQLDGAKPPTNTQAFLTTAVAEDFVDGNGTRYYEGYVYTLWNTQGHNQLIKDIAEVSCTSIPCGAVALEELMVRYRFYLATGYNFQLQNYSKAHNLAVMLAPEMVKTSNCITC